MPSETRVDVIVAGAGAAGLAAARALSLAKLKVLVLEARERVGGRIYTLHDGNSALPVELGAEFIHGEPEETFAIVRSASLAVEELPDEHYWSRKGQLATLPGYWDRIIHTRKALKRFLQRSSRRDASVTAFLASASARKEDRTMFRDFVEGYHAGYSDRVSGRWVAGDPDEEADSDPKQFRLVDGYDGLINGLQAGLDAHRVELRLSSVVTAIQWSRGKVEVTARRGIGGALEKFNSRAAIITLPAAVLRSGAVAIEPRLAAKERALHYIDGGQVFKMVLRFRQAFWNDERFLEERVTNHGSRPVNPVSFVHATGAVIPTWWTARPSSSPAITAWAGGPRAEALLDQEPATQLNQVLDSLSTALRIPRTTLDDQLETAALHDWRADPYSRAAYTYVGVNGGSAQAALAKPVSGTLFFAGEATNEEQTGTVAGAIASGERAGRQVLETIRR